MNEIKRTFQTIDEYILQFPEDVQEKLNTLRAVIKESAPEAVEKISYQMPTFATYRNLVHFAAYKNHIGFYPSASGIAKFKEEIAGYKNAKGSVQFPIDKPIPYELVKRIVKFRVEEEKLRAVQKKQKKDPSSQKK